MLEVITVILVICMALQYYRRTLMLDNNEGRCVMVTVCDTGFGNMLAKRLDSMGCTVFAGCLTETGGKELKKETSDRLTVVPLDVSSTESIKKACQIIKSTLSPGKGLWGLVNNAGIVGSIGEVEWLPAEDYKSIMEVNVYGMVETSRIFLPLIREEKGRIVCITSVMGRIAASNSTYVASKFAAEGYCDCLRRSVKKQGVTVHILEPGTFATNMTDFKNLEMSINKSWEQLDVNVKQFYGEKYKEDTIQSIRQNLKLCSPDTYKVVDAYVHALYAKYPKYRYLVGTDANTIFRLLWTVPEWVSDFILTYTRQVPAGMNRG